MYSLHHLMSLHPKHCSCFSGAHSHYRSPVTMPLYQQPITSWTVLHLHVIMCVSCSNTLCTRVARIKIAPAHCDCAYSGFAWLAVWAGRRVHCDDAHASPLAGCLLAACVHLCNTKATQGALCLPIAESLWVRRLAIQPAPCSPNTSMSAHRNWQKHRGEGGGESRNEAEERAKIRENFKDLLSDMTWRCWEGKGNKKRKERKDLSW